MLDSDSEIAHVSIGGYYFESHHIESYYIRFSGDVKYQIVSLRIKIVFYHSVADSVVSSNLKSLP